MLKFSKANSKIKKLAQDNELKQYLKDKRKIYSFDILSGHSCPGANLCLSKVIQGKIKDGPKTKFRCFSASQEAVFPNVFKARNNNFQTIKSARDKEAEIEAAMPDDLGICRIHVSGDFFSLRYLLTWLNVARNNPKKLFYAYTKSILFLLKAMNNVPDNFIWTASYGGRYDNLIDKNKLRKSIVVFSRKEAAELGYEIDGDDTHAAKPSLRDESFALLLHGVQPKGSAAAKALKELKKV